MGEITLSVLCILSMHKPEQEQFLQPDYPIEFNIELWGLRKYDYEAMRQSLFGKGQAAATAAPVYDMASVATSAYFWLLQKESTHKLSRLDLRVQYSVGLQSCSPQCVGSIINNTSLTFEK